MKSNIFTITLAVCLGLATTINFYALQGDIPQLKGPYYQQEQYPVYQQIPRLTTEPVYAPSAETPQTTTSTWRGWFSPTAWWAAAKAKAQEVASSALDMANAVRRGIGLEDVSYKTLGAAIAALAALNYNKETVLSVVSSVYDTVAPAVGAVASGVKTVVTNPYIAIPAATAAAVKTADVMDKANAERKEREKRQAQQPRYR